MEFFPIFLSMISFVLDFPLFFFQWASTVLSEDCLYVKCPAASPTGHNRLRQAFMSDQKSSPPKAKERQKNEKENNYSHVELTTGIKKERNHIAEYYSM